MAWVDLERMGRRMTKRLEYAIDICDRIAQSTEGDYILSRLWEDEFEDMLVVMKALEIAINFSDTDTPLETTSQERKCWVQAWERMEVVKMIVEIRESTRQSQFDHIAKDMMDGVFERISAIMEIERGREVE